MRAILFVLVCNFCNASIGVAQSQLSDTGKVQQAVRKSIQWLESDMIAWKERRHCAACHHGPMYLWSMNVAKQRGYEVNQARVDELTQWLIESDETRIFPKAQTVAEDSSSRSAAAADEMTTKMMGQNNLSQPTIYMLPAVRSMSPKNPLRQIGWKKLVQHLASAQRVDGSFTGRDAWRPIFNTPSVLTLQVALGLNGVDRQLKQPESDSIVAAAMKYLSEHSVDDSQQALALQILSSAMPDQPTAHREDTEKLLKQLMKLQRSDGGWAQTDERSSDAFATGQALLALHQANVDHSNPSVIAAIEYLVSSQQSDGTWLMSSRPNPENGQPATNLNPITYAATAWATLGLMSHVEGPMQIEE